MYVCYTPMSSSLNLWSNAPIDEPATVLLRAGAAGHRLTLASLPALVGSKSAAAGVVDHTTQVVFGQPEPASLLENRNLRWVHLSSAGYTRYDREDLREDFRARGVALTNSSHVFDEPCAQHLAAMILSLARQLPQCLDNQRGEQGWPLLERRLGSRLLDGRQLVLLYGFGAIARRLAEILAPLGLRLVGVRRRPAGDEGIPTATEAEADALLGQADHVVNMLPDNAGTRGFFGRERFSRCLPGARFYNIGRGTTVNQDALLEVLREGRLDAAYLDVTEPEPLPPEHPLWHEPRCFITPHSAGGHADESQRLVGHFLNNLRIFESGGKLLDRVF